ncbi:MAG: N-carbamoyl-D-amino-acid hydrolase [Myxococcales bacterium]|nr:MAG: N-carbamoyl-D-amino-acid hydrolase [Myxococcales bacterium]
MVIGVGQLGPVQKHHSRKQVVARLVKHLEDASLQGCELVVFPELALTTFFPRWYVEQCSEMDAYFERSMPNESTKPLFDGAKKLGIAFVLGYAELSSDDDGNSRHYNTSILVDASATIVAKYRKVHLPGHAELESYRPFQHLEQRYFERGDGFSVWDALGMRFGMCLCNDRRWSESYRVMGLQGVELIALGYNTPKHYPPFPEIDELAVFHHQLVMQAGAHQNACWVAAAAKAGNEEGVPMIGASSIISPSGQIVAQSKSEEDELIVAECDLALARKYKRTLFNFASHRHPPAYSTICK